MSGTMEGTVSQLTPEDYQKIRSRNQNDKPFDPKYSLGFLRDSEAIKSNPQLKELQSYKFKDALVKYHSELANLKSEDARVWQLALAKMVKLKCKVHDTGMKIHGTIKPITAPFQATLTAETQKADLISYQNKLNIQIAQLRILMNKNQTIKEDAQVLFVGSFGEDTLNNLLSHSTIISNTEHNEATRISEFYKAQMKQTLKELAANIAKIRTISTLR